MIPLIKNTFYKEEETKRKLIEFISKTDKLSMGEMCEKFEREFSNFQGKKYSILVNSGSSANLALVQSLINLGRVEKGDKVAFSSLTWSTNIMPLIQLGLNPIPIDVSMEDLNLSYDSFIRTIYKSDIKMLFLTNLLGFCSKDIIKIKHECKKRDIILIEDNCESLGSIHSEEKLGNFGIASTFSFFVGHAMSTIEGGMVCTDDEELAEMLFVVRAHGWDRNLSKEKQEDLRKRFEIDDFHRKFSFYYNSYNLRPTEITGFLGLEQLKLLGEILKKRDNIFRLYYEASKKNESLIKFNFDHMNLISNHAFPLLFKNKEEFEKNLTEFSKIMEVRPIVAGNMLRQPFLRDLENKEEYRCPNADKIHDFGFYIPNNPDLSEEEIEKICSLIVGEKSIPKEKYKEILEILPIICVDLVIFSREKGVLLVLRKNKPAQGEWWVPGGRLNKGERIEDALKRKAREELGITIRNSKFIKTYETIFSEGPYEIKTGVHTINLTYLVEIEGNEQIILDNQNESYKWVQEIENNLNPVVKEILKDSGVFR